ncbi:MAG: DUF4143 domain-containing protein [Raoultibacter sp.]
MVAKKNYLPRIADGQLRQALATTGAVQIKGPKWCGKTSTAEQHAKSSIFMQDPDHSRSYLQAADLKPSLLLEGKTPHLIDEWQMAPQIWDAVRFAVDRRGEVGQFILTGSSVPSTEPAHTGTGRISSLLMRPLSLFESLESKGEVSLADLFKHKPDIKALSPLSIDDIAFALARGGWPEAVKTTDRKQALQRAFDYVDAVIETDISRVDGVERNPQRVRNLMRSLARNSATQASSTTIQADLAASDATLSLPTLADYLNALRRIYVVEDLPAWNPALRSKSAIRTSATRHFVDPSIAVAALRATPDKLLADFELFGLLFESLCIRDLRIYAETIDADVFHYRDKNDLEADAVIALRDGRWAPIEVKLGSKEIDAGAANLLELAQKVDQKKMGSPAFLMVVTGTEFAYQREDGVYVVPLGCLKP